MNLETAHLLLHTVAA